MKADKKIHEIKIHEIVGELPIEELKAEVILYPVLRELIIAKIKAMDIAAEKLDVSKRQNEMDYIVTRSIIEFLMEELNIKESELK